MIMRPFAQFVNREWRDSKKLENPHFLGYGLIEFVQLTNSDKKCKCQNLGNALMFFSQFVKLYPPNSEQTTEMEKGSHM